MEQWSVKKFWCLTINIVAISLVLPVGFCHRSGAPIEACSSLTPNHGVSEQAPSTLPYVINVNVFKDPNNGQLLYTPGFSYNCEHKIAKKLFPISVWVMRSLYICPYAVTLSATTNGTASHFRGFLIQPRLVADNATVVGRFSASEGGDYQLLSCSGQSQVTIEMYLIWLLKSMLPL